ncbi:hypothetical protein [Streptomyces sp. CS081A]|uniref:hypothetical protein n=1 Tax=Streptomyces sp. CS081A TaxID=2162709 RepID=UPI000D50BE6E|nr:hypothetical protein [Streptomyces sp. CS081A]PVC71628.1 hypothetical protein DBP18_16165 [Streptomyces sp. CS081A]
MTGGRLRLVGAALTAVLAGCAPAPTGGHDAPTESASPARSPEDICADLVSYWVKEALKGSSWAGLDWEQKGLSNEQYEIHDEVLAAALAEERRAGRGSASAFADREARRRCEEARGATGSSENWRS